MKEAENLVMKTTEGRDIKVSDIANILGNQKMAYYQSKDNNTTIIKSLMDTADNMVQALLWYEKELAEAKDKIKKLTTKKK